MRNCYWCNGGVGLAISKDYLDAGATVILVGRNKQKLETVYNELKEQHADVFQYVMDTTDCSNFEKHIDNMSKLVNRKIDILVNCAGVDAHEWFPNITEEYFDLIINTNLKGVVFLSQVFAKYMINNHIEGNILNIGSAASYRPAHSAYMMSKWALRGFTLGCAKSCIKHNIVVNGINPGPVATKMGGTDNSNLNGTATDAQRYSTAEEISSMAVRLVSNECRMVLGEMVNITGGSGTLTFSGYEY